MKIIGKLKRGRLTTELVLLMGLAEPHHAQVKELIYLKADNKKFRFEKVCLHCPTRILHPSSCPNCVTCKKPQKARCSSHASKGRQYMQRPQRRDTLSISRYPQFSWRHRVSRWCKRTTMVSVIGQLESNRPAH